MFDCAVCIALFIYSKKVSFKWFEFIFFTFSFCKNTFQNNFFELLCFLSCKRIYNCNIPFLMLPL